MAKQSKGRRAVVALMAQGAIRGAVTGWLPMISVEVILQCSITGTYQPSYSGGGSCTGSEV